MPDRSPLAEIKSFVLHLQHYTRCYVHSPPPDDAAMQYALQWTLSRMKPAVTMLPEDFFEYTHFQRVLEDLEMRSSPGIPLSYTFTTNGDFLKYADGSWNQANVNLLWGLVQQWKENTLDEFRLRVFIKREPHKVAKVDEGRLRLIMAVPLVAQVVDHLLFGTQNKKEVDLFDTIPCAPGWGITYGGWRMVDSRAFGLDRKAWDYSVPYWLLMLELRLRFSLTINANSEWRSLCKRRYAELYQSPLFQLSSGAVYRQCQPGIVKSGAVNTIATNTHCQLLLHAYASFLASTDDSGYFLAMGDDTLQAEVDPEYVRVLGSIVNLKPPVVGEFCSMLFRRGGVVEPLNYGKHITNLLYQKKEHLVSALRSFQLLYGRSTRLARVRDMVFRIEPKAILTDAELAAILD